MNASIKTKIIKALAVLGLILALYIPMPASAAAPKCFSMNQGAVSPVSIPCSDLQGRGTTLVNDSCYIANGPGPSFTDVQQTNCSSPSISSTPTSSSVYPQCQTKNGKNYCSHQCGAGDNAVKTSINIGCRGIGNPIIDMTFAVIRFLSYGVGLIIIASIIVAGIQYSVSRDEPQAVAAAEARIKSSVIALLIFIFAYAILNYVIPAGFFSQ